MPTFWAPMEPVSDIRQGHVTVQNAVHILSLAAARHIKPSNIGIEPSEIEIEPQKMGVEPDLTMNIWDWTNDFPGKNGSINKNRDMIWWEHNGYMESFNMFHDISISLKFGNWAWTIGT